MAGTANHNGDWPAADGNESDCLGRSVMRKRMGQNEEEEERGKTELNIWL